MSSGLCRNHVHNGEGSMGSVQRNVKFESLLCICCRTKASQEKPWLGLSQYLPASCWLLGNGPAFTSTKPGGSPYTRICIIFKIYWCAIHSLTWLCVWMNLNFLTRTTPLQQHKDSQLPVAFFVIH